MFPSADRQLLPQSSSLFTEFSRAQWERLGTAETADTSVPDNTLGEPPLNQAEISRLCTLNDPLTAKEAIGVYLPLTRLLEVYADSNHALSAKLQTFTRRSLATKPPFVIGIAGSVAVGKSTAARLIKLLLGRSGRRVELITTDGYLLPNQVLKEQGLMERKGFPESYDRPALLELLAGLKGGAETAAVRQYSHLSYDVLPEALVIQRPEILIVEGLNLLQPPLPGHPAISDLIDFGIYLDADAEDIERWYVERFRRLQKEVFSNPDSFFRRYRDLSPDESVKTAQEIWRRINLPNLLENILPTRPRADLVLQKAADHRIDKIYLRKV